MTEADTAAAGAAWDLRHRTLANMRDFGGGFVTRLGAAAQYADATNYGKLQAAFPEFFAQYAAITPREDAND